MKDSLSMQLIDDYELSIYSMQTEVGGVKSASAYAIFILTSINNYKYALAAGRLILCFCT